MTKNRYFKVKIEKKYYSFHIENKGKKYSNIIFPELGGVMAAPKFFEQENWISEKLEKLKSKGFHGIRAHYAGIYRIEKQNTLNEIIEIFENEGIEIDYKEMMDLWFNPKDSD